MLASIGKLRRCRYLTCTRLSFSQVKDDGIKQEKKRKLILHETLKVLSITIMLKYIFRNSTKNLEIHIWPFNF